MSSAEFKAKGNAAFQEGKFAEAVEFFTNAIEIDQNDHVLYSNRSGAYASLNKYTEAKEDGEKCVKINPSWPKGYSRLALAQFKLGQQQEAAMTYLQGLQVDPTNESLKQGLMQCGFLTRQPQAYEREPTKKDEAQPTTTKPEAPAPQEKSEAEQFNELGNTHYKKREFLDALAAYDKAITADPRELRYRNNKAAVHVEMGEYDLCISECQGALDMRYEVKADYSTVAKIFNRMAACYRKQKNYDLAVQMYEKSLMEDNNRFTRSSLRETEALRDKALKDAYINPELAVQHREKGNEFFKNGDFPAAKKEYDEAIKRNPSDAKLYSNRAAAYTKLLEYPSALTDCEKAIELDPKFVKAWCRKGMVHFSQKDYQKAIAAYEKGLQIEPENQECRSGLEATFMKVQTGGEDEEQAKRAMSDPEIQQILADPQFQIILQQLTQNPKLLPEFLKDQKIAQGLLKLRAAGILRMV